MTDDMGSPAETLTSYRALRAERPDHFHDPDGSPIEILIDDRDIAAAQGEEAARRIDGGHAFPDVRIGVLACDPYLGFLARDAVRFADQTLGVYNRHIGEPGCVILPIMHETVVLIRIFRHATRDWAWEFPGGRVSPGEEPAITALHELEEEIGAIRPTLHALGYIHPYPALSSARMYLFTAEIDGIGTPQLSEGIASIEQVAPARLFEMVADGTISDGSAIACILKARLRGLL